MTLSTPKTLAVLLVGVLVLLGSSLVTADQDQDKSYEKQDRVVACEEASPPTVTILPREVSKSLKIDRLPTSEPIPLIVGTYWSCVTVHLNHEICRIKLVVCPNDQSRCIEV